MTVRLPSLVRRLVAVVAGPAQHDPTNRLSTPRRVRTAHVEVLAADVKSGLRQLRNAPGFTLVAAITLACGIGVNAAVFTVVKSVLLDSLPYADAERLVRIQGGTTDQPQAGGPLSAGTVADMAMRQQSFSGLAAFMDLALDAIYGSNETARIARLSWVEPQFFDTLGVSMALGRTFRREDAVTGLVPLSAGQLAPDQPAAIVFTHSAWTRLLGADPNAIGRDVRVNGIPRTVVGVLPRGFVGPTGEVDFYLALDLGPVVGHPIAARRAQWLGLLGRLKPDVSHDAARREVASIWSSLAQEYPADSATLNVSAVPLRQAMVGDTRTPLIVLMASAGLVLIITCANLAATLLSRALSRRKEFALRTALGAGRSRLVRQLLTESTVLGVGGGALGVLVAALILEWTRVWSSRVLPDYADPSLDWGAVLVTTATAMASGLLFGIVPALSVDRVHTQNTLGDESRGSSESLRSRRWRGALVACQMALCVSLLAGAGLLTRSLWAMSDAPLGFDPNSVLIGSVQLPPRTYAEPPSRFLFRQQFEERLQSLPGVRAATTATSLPTAVLQRTTFRLENAQPDEAPFVLFTAVSDSYFRTLRIPLRQGRSFDRRDTPDAPPTVVISDSLARRFWPAGGAVGARIRLGPDDASPLLEVVGVVGDVRNDRARVDAEPMAYRSTRQIPAGLITFAVRTESSPLALVSSIERELAALDSGLPLQQAGTLDGMLSERLSGRRLPVLLITAFGSLALLLASVGVYSLFASMTTAREREFGVRLALGSRPGALALLVLRQGAPWIAAGLVSGAFGMVVVARLVRNLLYGISPFDPVALSVSVLVLAACATIALLVPLLRAARVDAAVALRAP